MASDRPVRRCAIYTRKSSEEGLEQEFNSLHAQREACEAYIASQKSEGWKLIVKPYDDGGISGGTMLRPGLQQLLADIALGLIDVIVVYKVDRLTRSLSDFAKMVEVFDAHAVSFVAVTQQFNTTTSMGRLTLNVLLSFAQFEREVTGERIRDKFAASKKKGMFMGGSVPIGYRVHERRLYVVPEEAEKVRQIFTRYLACTGIKSLVRGLRVDGMKSKGRATRPPCDFTKGALNHILTNPIYIGKISHKGVLSEGLHDAIIDSELWEAVQKRRASNAVRSGAQRMTQPSQLLGKIFEESGKTLAPHHATKRGRRYRYYVSRTDVHNDTPSGWRLPAAELERKIELIMVDALNNQPWVTSAALKSEVPEHALPKLLSAVKKIEPTLEWVQEIHLRPNSIRVVFVIPFDPAVKMDVTMPMLMRRRGNEQKLVIHSGEPPQSAADPALIKVIGRAMRWWEMLKSGKAKTVKEVGEMEGVTAGYVSALLPYALLAPDILEAIVKGQQPAELTARSLMYDQALPMSWEDQKRVLGFS